jgi:uncharacterized protein
MKLNQEHKYKKAIIFISITFMLTMLFHFVLQFINEPQSYLGFAMLLPTMALLIMRFFVPVPLAATGITKKFNLWILISVVLPMVIVMIVYTLIILMTGQFIEQVNGSTVGFLFKYTLIGLSIAAFSALFEEVGWRGFLQMELEGLGYLRASIIVGVVWAVWHIPVALIYLRFSTPFLGISVYMLQLFLISLQISYVRLRAMNVLAAALMHGMINALLFNPMLFSDQFSNLNVASFKLVALLITLGGIFIYDWRAREGLFVNTLKK